MNKEEGAGARGFSLSHIRLVPGQELPLFALVQRCPVLVICDSGCLQAGGNLHRLALDFASVIVAMAMRITIINVIVYRLRPTGFTPVMSCLHI